MTHTSKLPRTAHVYELRGRTLAASEVAKLRGPIVNVPTSERPRCPACRHRLRPIYQTVTASRQELRLPTPAELEAVHAKDSSIQIGGAPATSWVWEESTGWLVRAVREVLARSWSGQFSRTAGAFCSASCAARYAGVVYRQEGFVLSTNQAKKEEP